MSNITALPGVVPQSLINDEAVEQFQGVIEHLKTGEVVGVAYATVKPNGMGTHGWNCPSGMGNHLFAALHCMSHSMLEGMK